LGRYFEGFATAATIWGNSVDTYKAQSAEVTIDGDVLILTRKKIGKDDVRRIPLAAVTDVRLKPGGRFAPAYLQLVLNDEPPADMVVDEPNTLMFPRTAKHTESLEGLHTRLQAVVEQNRATGGGPVAYDAARPGFAQRLADKAGESADRLARKRADLDAQRAEADAQRAEADRRDAEERAEGIRTELANAGITRPDVVAAAAATTFLGSIAVEIPVLAQMLRPDEPLLRAASASFDDRVGMVAITDSRLIMVDKALFADQVTEIPLTAIVTIGTERQFLANELTLHLQSAQTIRLGNVDDIASFANTLRDAVRQANTPSPTPQAPAPPRPDVLDQIAKLADLHAAGVLTDDEFQTKKSELLNRL
jgi:hypothetical protein